MPADPRRVKELFVAALDLPDPPARRALLDRECAGDADLRRRLDVLLLAHDHPESALERPLATPAGPGTGSHHPAGTAGRDPAGAPGAVVAGRYKLLERIGEGGMGEVWVADQLEPLRRRVALKLIKPGTDSRQVLARFEAERQALALMDHPHITKILDAGTADDGRPFFVMELVKGTPITEFCDARRLTPTQRLELFIPVCQAIQHAHMKGVIHRDIKPSNVLVELHDDRAVPKVIDFGVAKAVGQRLTEKTLYTGFGALVGTPAYMAPEQASFNARDVDTRADVYALGVLLYELLAGSPPFGPDRLRAAALDEVLRVVREEDPPRPSTRLSTSQARASIAAVRQSDPGKLARLVRGELDWIVMKALEKDRDRRYETAAGLARDVERHLKGEAVEARPSSAWYRWRKYVDRNRSGVTVTVFFVCTMLSFVGDLHSRAARAEDAGEAARAAQHAAEEAHSRAVAERAEADDRRSRAEANGREAKAALAFFGNTVPLWRRVVNDHPKPDKHRAIALHALGRCLNRAGRPAEAERVLREAAALYESALPHDGRRSSAAGDLGASLLAQGKLAEAEPLLLTAYRGLKTREGHDTAEGPPGVAGQLAELAGWLAELYEATGRPKDAAEWRAKLRPGTDTPPGEKKP